METYITQFKSLSTAIQNGKPAPHKAILLLSVIDLIAQGELQSNRITLSDALCNRFRQNWRTYINDGRESKSTLIKTPFKYMNSESFWVTKESANEATIDKRLYELLLSDANRNRAKEALREKYLGVTVSQTPHKVDFAALTPDKDKSLRSYQTDNKRKIYNFWISGQSVMLQMPTGTGKTRLFVSIVKDLHEWGKENKTAVKVLLLAHRVELIEQISNNLGLKYGLAHGVIASKNPENIKYPIQVGSVPTMHRRMEKWGEKDFDVIIVDEAHHVKAESYRTILKAYPNAKVLGVTATPCRLNGAGFRDVFQELILSDSVAKFISNGYLSNYDYYSIPPDSIVQKQIEGINEFDINGDYNERAMMRVMDTDKLRARIVDTYLKYAKNKKGIIYTINQLHNENVCKQFQERGITAKAIDSKTNAETRKEIVNDFRNGKFQILCNVNIFSEGFDCPDLEFVQLARPTKSLSLFLQQIGRGLRIAEGKEKVIFLDNVGLYNRFGLPSANRKWRMHFEGQEVTETELKGNKSFEQDRIRFMDDIEEGDESVELIQSTLEAEECMSDLKRRDLQSLERGGSEEGETIVVETNKISDIKLIKNKLKALFEEFPEFVDNDFNFHVSYTKKKGIVIRPINQLMINNHVKSLNSENLKLVMNYKFDSLNKANKAFKKIADDWMGREVLGGVFEDPNLKADLTSREIAAFQKYHVYSEGTETGYVLEKTSKGYVPKKIWTMKDCLYAYKQKYGKNPEKQVLIQEKDLNGPSV